MGKKSRRDAQKLEEETAALAVAKAAEAKAARRAVAQVKAEAAKAAPTAADGVVEAGEEVARPADSPTHDSLAKEAADVGEEHVAEPATSKPKKARFVREKVVKKAPAKDAPLPARNTTAAGKMMSRNVTLRPEEERSSGPKDDRATGPKPKSKP